MSNFILYSTSEDPCEITCKLDEPLKAEKLQLKLNNINLNTNYSNLYAADDLTGTANLCTDFNVFYKKGTDDEISDTISISPLINCDINSLMNGIIDLTKARFSTVSTSNSDVFNLSWGIDNFQGKLYFYHDTTVNTSMNYCIEFTTANNNVGNLLGFIGYTTTAIAGPQYANYAPSAEFVNSTVFLETNLNVNIATNISVGRVPTKNQKTVHRNVLYSVNMGKYASYANIEIDLSSYKAVALSDTTITEFYIKLVNVFGEKLRPIDSSSLFSVNFSIL